MRLSAFVLNLVVWGWIALDTVRESVVGNWAPVTWQSLGDDFWIFAAAFLLSSAGLLTALAHGPRAVVVRSACIVALMVIWALWFEQMECLLDAPDTFAADLLLSSITWVALFTPEARAHP
jgi:hypothetical protein